MASKTISELTTAGALDGSELVPLVQMGTTKKVTAQAIADLGGGSFVTLNGMSAITTGEVDTTNATPEILETHDAIPEDSYRRIDVEATAVKGGAFASRSFNCRREFLNRGGTVTSNLQQEMAGPSNVTATGSPLDAAEVNIELTGAITRVEAVGVSADVRWQYKIEVTDLTAPAASGPPFDLATLNLTAYLDGEDYDATTGTWPGRASAGTSGANDATEATDKPTAGATLNGIQTVDFDRAAGDMLSLSGTVATYYTAAEYSGAILAYADSFVSTSTNPNLGDALISDSNGGFGIAGNATGPTICGLHDDTVNGQTFTELSTATGEWRLILWRHSTAGNRTELSTDGGDTWDDIAPLTSADLQTLAGTLCLGTNYDGTLNWDGRIATVLLAPEHWDDTTIANIISALEWRWGVTL